MPPEFAGWEKRLASVRQPFRLLLFVSDLDNFGSQLAQDPGDRQQWGQRADVVEAVLADLEVGGTDAPPAERGIQAQPLAADPNLRPHVKAQRRRLPPALD